VAAEARSGAVPEALEGAGDQQINQYSDAKSQHEDRELLDLQRVFARVGFGFHDGD